MYHNKYASRRLDITITFCCRSILHQSVKHAHKCFILLLLNSDRYHSYYTCTRSRNMIYLRNIILIYLLQKSITMIHLHLVYQLRQDPLKRQRPPYRPLVPRILPVWWHTLCVDVCCKSEFPYISHTKDGHQLIEVKTIHLEASLFSFLCVL